MSTTYLASAALDQIDAAQATLDAHPATVDGTCLRCRTATCVRLDALTTLARYGRLPQRRPGASIPHPIERLPGAFRWFTHIPERGGPMFRKSSYSGDTNCVEVDTDVANVVQVRDNRRPERPPLTFTTDEWRAFIAGAKHGEFDVQAK